MIVVAEVVAVAVAVMAVSIITPFNLDIGQYTVELHFATLFLAFRQD